MKTLSILLFVVSTVTGIAQQPAVPDEAGAAIDALRNGLVESFTKGDIDGLLEHLAPDVLVTWQNGELCRGREEVRAFHNRMMTGDNKIVREVESAPEVLGRQMHGDWAVSWGNLNDHFLLMDGTDLPFDSVFTATISKQGDRWLVTAFHVSINAFENPVVGLAVRKSALWVGGGAGIVALLVGFFVGRKRRA
jgi:ketosteroid isomerase-like protein